MSHQRAPAMLPHDADCCLTDAAAPRQQTPGARLAVRGWLTCVLALAACRTNNDNTPPLTNVSTSGAFTAPTLIEASGLVTSSTDPNLFWAQNDSGNEPDLFAFDSTGRSLGVAHVRNAVNRDWEAIAIGPCPQGACVYIGDVGDNFARRPVVVIYRATEPTAGDTVTASVDSIRLHYPDGPRDVEAMWVAADTTIWLLSKRPQFASGGVLRQAQLYRIPAAAWHAAEEHIAEHVDSLPIVPLASDDRTWITDAALSPPDSAGERRLAVRTELKAFVFATDARTGRPGALLSVCALDVLRQRQGEGLTWLRDGRLLFDSEGAHAKLYAGRCP